MSCKTIYTFVYSKTIYIHVILMCIAKLFILMCIVKLIIAVNFNDLGVSFLKIAIMPKHVGAK